MSMKKENKSETTHLSAMPHAEGRGIEWEDPSKTTKTHLRGNCELWPRENPSSCQGNAREEEENSFAVFFFFFSVLMGVRERSKTVICGRPP